MEKKNKAPSFLMNVISIIFAQVAVKLLGVVYRIVITNAKGFEDAGNGYYNYGYQIYTLLLALSSIGIPNAISKLVSERCALDDFRGAMRIFKIALVLFSVIGLVFSAVMFLGAQFIATTIFASPATVHTIRVLSPAIFFVSVSSVIRGFFAGQQNMKATNTSQVLEQFLKCLSTILIVLAMVGSQKGYGAEYLAAGATLATTISTALSLGYLFIFYAANKKRLKERSKSAPALKLTGNAPKIAKTILMVSIPISLGAIVASLNRVIDLATVSRCLNVAFLNKFPNELLRTKKVMESQGMLAKCDVLINLPLALNTAFSTVLVPTVAGALAVNDYKTARDKISFSLLVSMIVALPCTLGYMALSGPILRTIYPNASEGALLFTLLAPTVFFSALSQTIYGSLQGMGKIYVPALCVLSGGILKVILNLILVPIPKINIYGAAISGIACQGIAFFIAFIALQRNLHIKLSFTKYFLKPLLAAIIMGGCALGVHTLLTGFAGNIIATIGAVGTGCIVYLALVLVFRIFTREELSALPFIGKKFK